MNRNDYRRAFIMLRAARPGYGGHARLERRTMTGSLYFIVTAPENSGTLHAALVGRGNGKYFAAPLGALARDRRGQLTLAYTFDPRNINGRPLDAYYWVAIADAGGGCAVVLTGNVDGSREVDPAALEAAVCALYAAPDVPAADLPGDEPPCPVTPIAAAADVDAPTTEATAAPTPQTTTAAPTTEATAVPTPEAPAAPFTPTLETTTAAPSPTTPEAPAAPAESDVKIYTRARRSASRQTQPDASPARPESDATATPAKIAAPEPATPAKPTAPEPTTPQQTAAPKTTTTEPAAPQQTAAPEPATPEPAAPPQTAAQALALDITRPWPAPAEPLRRLFATQVPAQAPLGDGYVYIQSAIPAGGGRDTCYVGLRAADGRVTGIRYAVPGQPAPEPPAGLDDYVWHDAGYWVLDIGIS